MHKYMTFICVSFNPRTRDGCDNPDLNKAIILTVSIHAPVMGATSFIESMFSDESVSIHAPVMGATLTPTNNGVIDGFQSTHP